MKSIVVFTSFAVCFALSLVGHASSTDRMVIDGLIRDRVLWRPDHTAPSPELGVEMKREVEIDTNVAMQSLTDGAFIEATFFNEPFLIRFDRTQSGSPGVITYVGSLFNDSFEKLDGSILLTIGGGTAFGLIKSPQSTYLISPSPEHTDDSYVLRKMKPSAAPGITDFPELNPQDFNDAELDLTASMDETPVPMAVSCCTTDVLVMYTPTVRGNLGGTSATVNWINTIIADFNQKLAELGLSTNSLALSAALETSWPTIPTTYHENTTHNGANACYAGYCDSLVADQYWLATNASIAGLRNQYSADLVVLITADSRKHVSDFAHGFADFKNPSYAPLLHGGACGGTGRRCGEFITVRDAYALSNLTFHHETGHAFGMAHNDGVTSFGYYSNGSEQLSNGSDLKPFTIMSVNSSNNSICLWSSNTSSPSCQVRLPFFEDKYQFRNMYYSGAPTPRKFSPTKHAEDQIIPGMQWLGARR